MSDNRSRHDVPTGRYEVAGAGGRNGGMLRADLIAANIFQRMAVGSRFGYTREMLAARAYDDAAAFIAESQRRNPQTGELIHPTDGLPKDE